MAPVRFVAVASKQSIEALINRTRTMSVVLENHARVDPLVAETKAWNWNQVTWDTGITPRVLSQPTRYLQTLRISGGWLRGDTSATVRMEWVSATVYSADHLRSWSRMYILTSLVGF